MIKLLPRRMTSVIAGIAGASLAFTSLNSVAQTANDPASQAWYQVELLVFSYQNPNNGWQEIWPQQPVLHYPQRIVTLSRAVASEIMLNNPPPAVIEPVDDSMGDEFNPNAFNDDPEYLPELESEFESELDSELDSERQTELPPQPASDPALSDSNRNQDDIRSQPLLPGNMDVPGTATDGQFQQQASLPAPLLVKLGQQPFTLLESQQLQLGDAARRLSRQTDITLLFHGAWRQPISERNQAESILIQGGERYDNHFELEGSISVGLERYLHIKTDLWLSSFVSNAGQPQNIWPVLPPRPISSSLMGIEQQPDPFMQAPTRGFSSGKKSIHNPFSELAANQYRVDRTIALQQERRMRSDELHYIDHPMLGLLVKIIPYEFPIVETVEPETGSIENGIKTIEVNATTTKPVSNPANKPTTNKTIKLNNS